MFRSVLVANRGEIALRVLRTLREMGIRGVVALSSLDLPVPPPLADKVICLGGAEPERSYMDAHRLLSAAVACGADAVHPGYGFLSEDPRFSSLCREMGLAFIGPSPETLGLLCDKEVACRLAGQLGIPNLLLGRVDGESPARFTARIPEYPVIIKPVKGGGGKGIRIAREEKEFERRLNEAKKETPARYSEDGFYVERFLPQARHLEVQVMRDAGGRTTAFPPRDCSLQHRNQKWMEETPASKCPAHLKACLSRDACRLVEAAELVGIATVEFLVAEDGYFFLEVNPRIQVEHTVTEMIAAVDLVREQLRLSAGEPLKEPPPPRGHAVEARLYVLPRGESLRFLLPGGPGIRVDAAPQNPGALLRYDPLLAKICAWAPDRASALARLSRALEETVVEEASSNLFHLQRLVDSEPFRHGEYYTHTLEDLIGGDPWITCAG